MPTDHGTREPITWNSTVVAVGILALLTAIEITAIARYAADDALKVWAALGPIVGVVTGAFVTYFFSRQAVDQAEKRADQAEQQASGTQNRAEGDVRTLQQELEQARKTSAQIWGELIARITTAQGAVTNTAAQLSPADARDLVDATKALFEPPPPPPLA